MAERLVSLDSRHLYGEAGSGVSLTLPWVEGPRGEVLAGDIEEDDGVRFGGHLDDSA